MATKDGHDCWGFFAPVPSLFFFLAKSLVVISIQFYVFFNQLNSLIPMEESISFDTLKEWNCR
jgi:hypothetical protein